MAKGAKRGRGKRSWRKNTLTGIFFALVILLLLFFPRRMNPPEERRSRVFHAIPFPKEESPKEIPKGVAPLPSLALIIDDGGYSLPTINEILRLGKRMTFAILPHAVHTRKCAERVQQAGSEVMLHLPMEPQDEEHLPLEASTVQTGMGGKEIQAILRDGLGQLPGARGVNNHMGSKATQDGATMMALMKILKERNLYFVDSYTTPRTLGPEMARRAGVRFARNDKFIDREEKLPAIKEAIRFAIGKAKKEGKAVAIGHPHPLTVQAIREMMPEIETEVRLVFASEVVE